MPHERTGTPRGESDAPPGDGSASPGESDQRGAGPARDGGLTVPASVFWISGGAFFAIQLGTLLFLLRDRRCAGGPRPRSRAEIVWTLVPAALLAALALMATGLTEATWTQARGQLLAPRRGAALGRVLVVPETASEAR